MEKTTFFNLIILDESGSMSPLRAATIEGCNSVINSAREAQEKHSDTQRVLLSIYAFQSGSTPSRYLVKHKPAAHVADLTEADYKPWGATPLYDAIGTTLSDLETVASTHEDATGMITIITDGMENSSTCFSHQDCVNLIDRFKEMGWMVNFIGANIDVDEVSDSLHVDNRMSYDPGSKGMRGLKFSMSMVNDCIDDLVDLEVGFGGMTREEKIRHRKANASKSFAKHKAERDARAASGDDADDLAF